MSSNANSSDQLSQFSKALSTTATAFLGSQSWDDTILSYSTPYKKILHQAITQSGSSGALMKLRRSNVFTDRSDNKTFQDIYSAESGKSFFQNSYSNTKTSFRVLSYLSDDLLREIPNAGNGIGSNTKLLTDGDEQGKRKRKTKQEFSLFQGFSASLPVINETINTQRKQLTEAGEQPDSESALNSRDFHLPDGLSAKEIKTSYSTSFLTSASQSMVNGLDLLEIQKNLAASEIKEIDLKIEKLKTVRELVFQRVARLEQNELFLEKHLASTKDRIDMIKEYGLEEDQSDNSVAGAGTLGKGSHAVLSEGDDEGNEPELRNGHSEDSTVESDSEDKNDGLMSQSIYQKLKNRPTQASEGSRGARSNYSRRHSQVPSHQRQRKTFPTLQQYYEPGTKIATFESAHDDSITCLDFDMPFGTMCTAGRLDHSVKVWDLSKQLPIGNLPGHLASISCMQMDQYNTLVTGGRDAVLKLWDVERAIEIFDEEGELPEEDAKDLCSYTFDAHVDEITALHFEGATLISGSQDRTVRQWDLDQGKCIQTLDIDFGLRGTSDGFSTLSSKNPRSSVLLTHNDPPIIGALQSFDAALATGTKDGIVRLWDLRSGKVVRTLEGHTDAVTDLQFDSINLVTGSLDRSVRIWDLRTGMLSGAFALDSPISSLRFDLSNIVVANNENSVKIYDRKQDRHWECGGPPQKPQEPATDETVEFVRYKSGYLLEGRSNGDVNGWAI
ncbi:LAMI_0E11958g1_1 [Lachancea mirantina]|uniref:LAMI_0E11958g1_1 n=1 Tax=Lachancea mirantina TaxID=1230905 RepID=A0A1G4JQ09_9SACH|nr:LAMI_0E11958g1_1 [Lachancea mirantina]